MGTSCTQPFFKDEQTFMINNEVGAVRLSWVIISTYWWNSYIGTNNPDGYPRNNELVGVLDFHSRYNTEIVTGDETLRFRQIMRENWECKIFYGTYRLSTNFVFCWWFFSILGSNWYT